MNNETFNEIISITIERARNVLIAKQDEYATEDRLHNFRVAAQYMQCSEKEALLGFMTKHLVSISDMCKSGKEYDQDMWDEKIGDAINYLLLLRALASEGPKITGQISDGYHTFDELYMHRAMLFLRICRDHKDISWKSKKHADGSMYEGMFICGVETPLGQATYHYNIDPYFDMFSDIAELEKAPQWDGHTPDEALIRIMSIPRDSK